jgi:hypothetical protein
MCLTECHSRRVPSASGAPATARRGGCLLPAERSCRGRVQLRRKVIELLRSSARSGQEPYRSTKRRMWRSWAGSRKRRGPGSRTIRWCGNRHSAYPSIISFLDARRLVEASRRGRTRATARGSRRRTTRSTTVRQPRSGARSTRSDTSSARRSTVRSTASRSGTAGSTDPARGWNARARSPMRCVVAGSRS